MSLEALNKKQFGAAIPVTKIKKDPKSGDKHDSVHFTGADGSKTMMIHHGRLPKPPKRHPHHFHSGKRTRRAR